MKRIVWITLAIAVVALLAAVAMILVPIFTHENTGNSGQAKPEGFVSEVSATGADGLTRTLRAFTEAGEPADLATLSEGDTVIVRGDGFDASGGIYVGFCAVPDSPDERPTPCLGGIPEDAKAEKDEGISDEALESAWVTNNWAWQAFASHSYTDKDSGSFEVKLAVPSRAGDGIDCGVDECGLFTRADHTALSERVQDVYMPIAFSD